MTRASIVYLAIITFLMVQCKNDDTQFSITKDSIGKLSRNTLVSELQMVFAQDSIVSDADTLKIGNGSKKIKIYEKGGAHLLTLTPDAESIQKIKNIRVFDPRYKTARGVGLTSTFKDIKDNYPIRKIVTSINNVVIFLKDSDLYFTIDKQELPSSLRYGASTNIEAVQIPDDAKIKYLMIGWE
ncbi:hypothetical protein K8352_17035 [Flavobacteriaceae bacterium F89]|uniref:Uncharacterized protein n=1 Tax=Cerina litoralis TaxID=2874477 RepID=A0AAE3EY24_9FLAO|nr:hypothetical protein [Cerina litoralis]MCG2462469.1 hypothetical protein [Cerina litoralis]